MKYSRKKLFSVVLTGALIALAALVLAMSAKWLLKRVGVIKPPIALTARTGVLSPVVIRVHNLSNLRGMEFYIYVRDATHSLRSPEDILAANQLKEVGYAETGWKFKEGDSGFVSVKGYSTKLNFEICPNGGYRTWFAATPLGGAIAEVDVAALRRAELFSATKREAQELWTAIAAVNAVRIKSGFPEIWPRGHLTFGETASALKGRILEGLGRGETTRKDMAREQCKTSDQWISDLQGIYKESLNRRLVNVYGKWSVLCDVGASLSSSVPVLISANFPCDRLCSSWDGVTDADDIIPLVDVDRLSDKDFVAVYADGRIVGFDAKCATLRSIYGEAFNTFTNGVNGQLSYLTSKGIKNARP